MDAEMIGLVEVADSIDRIRRAETRVVHQQSIVGHLRPSGDSEYVACANDLLKRMEQKLTSLRIKHRSLLASTKMARCSSPTSH